MHTSVDNIIPTEPRYGSQLANIFYLIHQSTVYILELLLASHDSSTIAIIPPSMMNTVVCFFLTLPSLTCQDAVRARVRLSTRSQHITSIVLSNDRRQSAEWSVERGDPHTAIVIPRP